MLYNKSGELRVRRSYENFHIHTSSEQVHRLQTKGKVMLNGKQKKRS
jgi:hypothetical protein